MPLARPHKRWLRLELLESRTVPSILFDNATLATVSDGGGPVITHPDVDLVFWGAGWNSDQTLMSDVTSAVTTLMNSSLLSGLSQYRGVGNGQLLRTDFISDTSPAAHTNYAQIGTFLAANLNKGTLPVTPSMDSQILYMVIPQPGTTDPDDGFAAAHSYAFSNSGIFHYGFTRNIDSLDDITRFFSHELIEAATDPEGSAFQVTPVNYSAWNEICDGEAQNYVYRLDGILVQASFSQADHAYAVYDGNTQQFLLSSTLALTINGDQLADPNDTVTVDVAADGYTINLNGEVAQFDPGAVSALTINTLSGNDTVNLERTLRSLRPVTINLGNGSDTVNLSPTAETLSNLSGTTTINGGSGSDALNLFDQGSNSDTNYTITDGTVAGTGMASIKYHSLSALALNTSNGTNSITVQETPAGTAVAVHGGSGVNTLIGSVMANTWDITGGNSGGLSSASIAGPVSFTVIQNLVGGAGTNAFVFSDGAGISGNLDGGSGGGALDYSAYSSSVIVDLPTGFATGVGGSVSSIATVLGGSAAPSADGVYNLLIGAGGNVLNGGTGRRNILVAGASASTLNAGDGEDLLIAGSTAYDTEAGLGHWQLIAAYWAGSDDYATRLANLTSGTGVPLLDANIVTGNSGGNTLNGNGALALFYTDGLDIIIGFDSGSQQVTITP